MDNRELFDDLEQDRSLPTNEEQEQLADAVRQLKVVQEARQSAEEHLRELKEKEQNLEMEVIPGIMEQTGLTEIRTIEGDKVILKDIVRASIPKRSEHKAYQWLEDHGAGDLIKADVVTHFNRDELSAARELAAELADNKGLSADLVQKVHPQTLSAYVREQLKETGEVPPDDIFNLFIGRKASIK